MDRYKSLVDFNTWANRKMIDQLRSLSDAEFTKELGGSFPSLRLTIVHLLTSDWLWLNRFQGKPLVAVPTDWDMSSAEAIDQVWTPIQQAMKGHFQALPAADLDKDITFTTLKGATFHMPLWQLINHVVNHGTYHRGQITNMIRMLGHTPVNTDLFLFFNEQNEKVAAPTQ